MKMECESFHLVPHHSPHDHSDSILLRVERQWVVRRWSTEIDRDQLKLLKRMWREKYVWSWPSCFYHSFPFVSGSWFLFVWKLQAVILFGENVMLCRAMCFNHMCLQFDFSLNHVSHCNLAQLFFGQQTLSKIDVFRTGIGSSSRCFFPEP